MKSILFFICIMPYMASAQNFFPLAPNNKYQIYMKNAGSTIGNTTWNYTYYLQHAIIEDTLINDIKFFRMSTAHATLPFPDDPLLMYDTLLQKLFIKLPEDDTIRLAVDFNAPADSVYTSYLLGVPRQFKSGGNEYKIIFNHATLVHKVSTTYSGPHLFIREYEFAEDIGIYYSYFSTRNVQYRNDYESTLISAILDSMFINPITLKILDLNPLMNRPVNTFPFTLTGTYQTNYNLVDTFYVELILERDGQDIYVWTKAFINGNTTIYYNDLQPGDKLKLRAIITDYSIYKNIDVFPDSGFAVIEILNPVNVTEKNDAITYSLEQNFPNPFNPKTLIRFEIPEQTFVVLKVFNILGNEIVTLLHEEKPAGRHDVEFEATGLSSGMYFYTLSTSNYSRTKKMILIR